MEWLGVSLPQRGVASRSQIYTSEEISRPLSNGYIFLPGILLPLPQVVPLQGLNVLYIEEDRHENEEKKTGKEAKRERKKRGEREKVTMYHPNEVAA